MSVEGANTTLSKGCVVTLDWYRPDIKAVALSTIDDLVRAGSQCHTAVSQDRGGPPLATVFLANTDISSMLEGLAKVVETKSNLYTCEKSFNITNNKQSTGASYFTHATLRLEVSFPDRCESSMTFHSASQRAVSPRAVSQKTEKQDTMMLEEGEVVIADAQHFCSLWMIPHGTQVSELHDYQCKSPENRPTYIHGMRQVMGLVAGYICSKFVVEVNKNMPLIPINLSVEDYVDLFNRMELQISPFSEFDEDEMNEDKNAVMCDDDGDNASALGSDSTGVSDSTGASHSALTGLPATNSVCNRRRREKPPYYVSLQESVEKAEETSPAIKSIQIKRVAVNQISDLQQPESVKQETVKRSVHPLGSAWSKQVLAVPFSMMIMNFMRSVLGEHDWSREKSCRFVLGAYNARRYMMSSPMMVSAGTKRSISASSSSPTAAIPPPAFIQDVDCNDMRRFAGYVQHIISNSSFSNSSFSNSATNSTSASSNGHLVRSMKLPPSPWDGLNNSSSSTFIHAIKLGGTTVTSHHQESVVVFAMCNSSTSLQTLDTQAPTSTCFALSGMRHDVMKYVPFNQYSSAPRMPDNQDSMLEMLKTEVSPTLCTDLNHRQRFALQLSCVVNACMSHPSVFGPHRRVLRELVTEWYRLEHRRGKEEGSTASRLQNWPTEEDICFMNNGMFRTKRDLNPHWWYTMCVC